MNRYTLLSTLFLGIASLGLAACQPSAVPTQTAAVRATPAAATFTPAATIAPTATSTAQPAAERAWWNDAVFYEVFVRSYADSDGDGIGDFKGLISKLDTLNDGDPATTDDLGVTALWLMPIFPSPSYHGYDVTDYMAVNPQYGTLEDFRALLDEAHRRGMRVIIDFVINHTSDEHPWFVEAQKPESEFRDYYVWSETDPGYVGPWGETVWHRGMRSGYYYGVFWSGMPDLNLANPKVTGEIEMIARYWLSDVGVDGFRVDAARHLVEDGTEQVNTPETHAWFQDFYLFFKAARPQAMIVGEVWDNSYAASKYVKNDELDLVFAFDLASALVQEVNDGIAERINGTVKFELDILPAGRFATFLTNHDQNRVMGQLGGDVEKAKAAATLLLTLPGTPFVYYGEEIGMVGTKPDEKIRTPMQWNTDLNAGFSAGTPWIAVNDDYPDKNVAVQTADAGSLLSHYRRLIHLRNASPALRGEQTYIVQTGVRELYAMLRSDGDQWALVLLNLGSAPLKEYALKSEQALPPGSYSARMVLGEGAPEALVISDSGAMDGYQPLPEIPAHASLVISLEQIP